MIAGAERGRLRLEVWIDRDVGMPVSLIAVEHGVSESTVYRLLREQRDIWVAEPSCEACGCSESRACVDEWGEPCGWAAPGLCTACAREAA